MTAWPARRGLSRGGRWAVGIGAAVALGLWGKALVQLAVQIVLSCLLCALALPLCRRLEKRRKRPAAALLSVAGLTATALGTVALLMPPLISQITLIVNQAPRFLGWLRLLWQDISRWEWVRALGLDQNGPEQWIAQASQWIAGSLPALLSALAAGADSLSRAFLTPVLSYYFLRDREMFTYRLSLWIPLRHRRRALTALGAMRREAGCYVHGQMLVSLAVAVMTAAGLLICGIPAWLALGLIMGLCEWIPYVGPLIGGVPIVLFSLPMGISSLLWALGITVAVQQIEGYFLSPRLMAGATGLHPAAVLVLLSAGGLLLGLPGMMAAIPAFVCLRGAARVLYDTRT